jgi:hypothetical protein
VFLTTFFSRKMPGSGGDRDDGDQSNSKLSQHEYLLLERLAA